MPSGHSESKLSFSRSDDIRVGCTENGDGSEACGDNTRSIVLGPGKQTNQKRSPIPHGYFKTYTIGVSAVPAVLVLGGIDRYDLH